MSDRVDLHLPFNWKRAYMIFPFQDILSIEALNLPFCPILTRYESMHAISYKLEHTLDFPSDSFAKDSTVLCIIA